MIPKQQKRGGILSETKNWCLLVDLDKQLKFPSEICETSRRPDIVIYSLEIKTVILVELTCPSEENIEIRHQEKLERYEELVAECTALICCRGWRQRVRFSIHSFLFIISWA